MPLELRSFSEMQRHTCSPLWPQRALYVLLLLLHETRRTLITATPSAKGAKLKISFPTSFQSSESELLACFRLLMQFTAKTRMEIREQDFSFNDDGRERPVIEVVTKDVRTSDIFSIMEAIGEEVVEEGASWWKDAVTEDISRQDVVLLVLIALFVLWLVGLVLQTTWKVARLPMQMYDTLRVQEDKALENENSDSNSDASSVRQEDKGVEGENTDTSTDTSPERRKELAIIRFCHLQFLLVVEKLKREMREDKSEDTQQMVASLSVYRQEEGKVTLSEILATLQMIQAKDSSFKTSEVEEHLADIKQDVEDEEDFDSGLPEAWERLQEIYASFLRIQATIIRRQNRKTWEWQMQQHEQHQSEASPQRPRQHATGICEDATEVLHELQELTKELPQGFTAGMFTALGNAMHEKAVAPETKPASSPQATTAHTSTVCA